MNHTKNQGRNRAVIIPGTRRIIARGNKEGVQPVARIRTWAALAAIASLSASCAGKATRSAEEVESSPMAAAVKPERSPAEVKRNNEATAEYHYSMAQAYVAEGNPDGAIEELKLTLMYDPNSALIYARLATEYVKKGMMSAAMDACKEAIAMNPKFSEAHLMLAGLYSASHENAAALAEYDKVLKYDPKNDEAAVYRAQTQVDLGKIVEATSGLRAFVKKNPESALGWYSLGRAEESQDHFKEAVVAYKKAADLRPNFNQPALALGSLYESKKMTTQAVATYQALWDETQDSTAANRLATIYLKEEKYDLAVPYLESLEGQDPDDLNARIKLGLVQMELKQYPKAIDTFKGILAKTPDSDRVHYYLGSLYEEMKNVDEAVVQLKQIKQDSKMYPDAVLHVAYLIKQRDGMDPAKSYIGKEIERSPRVANFYIYSASLEEDSKNVPAAVRQLEKAVAIFPEDEKVRYYLQSLRPPRQGGPGSSADGSDSGGESGERRCHELHRLYLDAKRHSPQ